MQRRDVGRVWDVGSVVRVVDARTDGIRGAAHAFFGAEDASHFTWGTPWRR